MTSTNTCAIDEEFARETGDLTARRWTIGASLYLIFEILAAFVEWQYYPDRGRLLLPATLSQVVIAAIAMILLHRWKIHPHTAWVAWFANLGICAVLAIYNTAVGGDMLYVLMTYLSFILVSSVFIPWGAGFQLAMTFGVIGAYAGALSAGAQPGPIPAYDFISIAAATVLSTLGALYIDRYRRQWFVQASALRDANRQLAEASRARMELLSGLSHDMRTPLAVLVGYGDMLGESEALPGDLRPPVHSIRREARELMAMVDGVLDLARMERGRLPLQHERFSLASALEPLRETTEDLLRDRGIELRWEVAPELEIEGDAHKVQQIVRNLLSNAAKFTRDGHIDLTARRVADGVEITVSDTGIGIARADQERIFEQFHQIGATDGHGTGGLGFGLYLVKLLADLIGARVRVESEPDKGSTFRVWLRERSRETAVES